MTDANGKAAVWQVRERLGLSRETVARRLDPPVSVKTLERWEKGENKNPIRRWRLEQLARVYDVRSSDLVDEVAA